MAIQAEERRIRKEFYKNNITVSKNIRLLRLIYNYSQQYVADILHISRSAYRALEENSKCIDLDTIAALAKLYNISMDSLITFDISQQLLDLLMLDNNLIKADLFIEKYLSLSDSGKDTLKIEINKLKEYEIKYKKFPWRYKEENNGR